MALFLELLITFLEERIALYRPDPMVTFLEARKCDYFEKFLPVFLPSIL